MNPANSSPTALEPMHVSMAVDRGFELPLGVSLLSLAESHHREGTECAVSVFCAGLDKDVYRRIEGDVAGRIDIEWIEVDPGRLQGAHYTVGLSRAALFRILLPELLPTRSRTIYLDADTLVLEPLTELWETEIANNLLAAVRDAGAPYAAGIAGTTWRALDLPPDTDYFNSGVLLLPLDVWRKEGTTDAALDHLRENAMPWGDQDALNLVARSRWLELPRRWNVQTADVEERSLSWVLWRADVEAATAQPTIVHFSESPKPWTGKLSHPYADLWFATLEHSSWEWRSPAKSKLALGRVVRAARVLRYG